jgi:hypothetical protein
VANSIWQWLREDLEGHEGQRGREVEFYSRVSEKQLMGFLANSQLHREPAVKKATLIFLIPDEK